MLDTYNPALSDLPPEQIKAILEDFERLKKAKPAVYFLNYGGKTWKFYEARDRVGSDGNYTVHYFRTGFLRHQTICFKSTEISVNEKTGECKLLEDKVSQAN